MTVATRPRPESHLHQRHALSETQIKFLHITQPNGLQCSAWRRSTSREVAGVVNPMDGRKSAAVPLDLINAGGAKI